MRWVTGVMNVDSGEDPELAFDGVSCWGYKGSCWFFAEDEALAA